MEQATDDATAQTAYDTIAYPSFSHDTAHPDVLATLARAIGLSSADLTRSRVLELGCGDGAHLIPIAEAYPDAVFLGLDLSRRAIARGQEDIAAVGLTNIRLEVADLTTWRPEPESFDYVIAHGLYAWVPPAVQDAVLAITGEALGEGGLAVISYNVAPGCNLRLMLRELVEFDLRDVEDPAERETRGYAIVTQALEDISPVTHVSAALREETRLWAQMGSESVFHDILAPCYAPTRLIDFVAHARRHGLAYLGDADGGHLRREAFPNDGDKQLLALSGGDVVEAEHRHDLRAGRSFRHTVLRKGGADFTRTLDLAALAGLHASLARELGEGADLGRTEAGEWSMTFGTNEGFKATVKGDPARDFIHHLADVFPGSAPVSEMGLLNANLNLVALLYAAGAVKLSTQPVVAAASGGAAGSRPAARGFSRRQAATNRRATRLDHNMVSLDPMGAKLLVRLDGRSTLPEIAAALGAEVGVAPSIVLQALPENLDALAKRGLLIRA